MHKTDIAHQTNKQTFPIILNLALRFKCNQSFAYTLFLPLTKVTN